MLIAAGVKAASLSGWGGRRWRLPPVLCNNGVLCGILNYARKPISLLSLNPYLSRKAKQMPNKARVSLTVLDLETSIAFYTTLLNFELLESQLDVGIASIRASDGDLL